MNEQQKFFLRVKLMSEILQGAMMDALSDLDTIPRETDMQSQAMANSILDIPKETRRALYDSIWMDMKLQLHHYVEDRISELQAKL